MRTEREPAIRPEFGGSPLLQQGELDFSPAEKRFLSQGGLYPLPTALAGAKESASELCTQRKTCPNRPYNALFALYQGTTLVVP